MSYTLVKPVVEEEKKLMQIRMEKTRRNVQLIRFNSRQIRKNQTFQVQRLNVNYLGENQKKIWLKVKDQINENLSTIKEVSVDQESESNKKNFSKFHTFKQKILSLRSKPEEEKTKLDPVSQQDQVKIQEFIVASIILIGTTGYYLLFKHLELLMELLPYN